MGKTLSNVNQIGAEFLLDLDLALTFMDIAETSRIENVKHPNHNNARRAYESALNLLKNLTDTRQRQVIDAKLALLKARLQAEGQQF